MRIVILTTDNRGPYREFERQLPWFGPAPEALLQGFALLPEVEVHVVSCIRKPVAAPEKLAENIWFHSLVVPKIGWMRTGYWGCLRAVKRRLKHIQPDLVHGQGSELEAAICAAFSGYPNVITLLGIMREMVPVLHARPGSFNWCAAVLETIALRRTAGVLCNSRFTAERVRFRTAKTWLVANAVREDFFQKPPPATRPRQCTVLNVGTVCSYKRQLELLDALRQLRREGLDFRARFIGGASRQEAYSRSFLDQAGQVDFVSVEGFKSVDELRNAYDASSALIHVSAIETFGLVVAEALARNLALFGFSAGGVSDIASGVPGAKLFADGDWGGLKQALSQWIRSGFPSPTGAAAVIRERYSPRKIAAEHLPIYREVLGRNARR